MNIKCSEKSTLALARELSLPSNVCEQLAKVLTPSFLNAHLPACYALTSHESVQATWETLNKEFCQTDPTGISILTLYLTAACITRQKYCENNIPDDIFISTMGCFARFLNEEHSRSGNYAFTRGFWGWRHLACRIFRLGTLEFEYRTLNEQEPKPLGLSAGCPVLFVHIPSNAVLKGDTLQAAYLNAKEFFTSHCDFCESGLPQAVLCCTWLLSSTLCKLLPLSSGILCFAQDYKIFFNDIEDESFYLWLFDGRKPPAALPCNTRLQRDVAAYVQCGGKIGIGYGVLQQT